MQTEIRIHELLSETKELSARIEVLKEKIERVRSSNRGDAEEREEEVRLLEQELSEQLNEYNERCDELDTKRAVLDEIEVSILSNVEQVC